MPMQLLASETSKGYLRPYSFCSGLCNQKPCMLNSQGRRVNNNNNKKKKLETKSEH